jgi:hypothetical protein
MDRTGHVSEVEQRRVRREAKRAPGLARALRADVPGAKAADGHVAGDPVAVVGVAMLLAGKSAGFASTTSEALITRTLLACVAMLASGARSSHDANLALAQSISGR